MAKTLAVNRIRAVKRRAFGGTPAVLYTPAPIGTVATGNIGTHTRTCGLTVTANYIHGVVDIKNTNPGKKITCTAWGLTPGGSIKLAKTSGTPSATKGFVNTGQFFPPGSIKMKVGVTAGAISHVKAKSISVNELTTIRRE